MKLIHVRVCVQTYDEKKILELEDKFGKFLRNELKKRDIDAIIITSYQITPATSYREMEIEVFDVT